MFSAGLQVLSHFSFDNQKKTYLDSVYKNQKDKVDNARLTLSEMARFSYESMIFNNHIVHLLAKASQGGVEQQDQAREQLHKALLKDFKWLKTHQVRQLHFHLPGNISFLRFHRPNKYGDSLVKVRHSINLVNQTKKPVFGFEEGRIFNGFRHVYPLFFHKKFVGTVEISYGISGINQVLAHKGESSDIFILSNAIIDQKLFSDEKSNYTASPFGKEWLIDKTAIEESLNMSLLPQDIISTINAKVKKTFTDTIAKRASCQGCSKAIKINQKFYTISFLPIFNTKDEKAGYILSYADDTFLPIIHANQKLFNGLIILLNATLSIMLYVFLNMRLKALKNIQYSAVHDELTGVFNRKELTDDLPGLLSLAQQTEQPLGIIFFDIDHFKNFNDTHGHMMGDEVLVSISHLVESNLRQQDLFVRWGGEEFIIVIPNTNLEMLKIIAEKLRKSIEEHKFTHLNLSASSSFGITLSTSNDSPESLIDRADKNLYLAKERGRNNVVAI